MKNRPENIRAHCQADGNAMWNMNGGGGLQNVYFLLPKTYYPGALEVHSGEGATEAQSGSAGEYVDGTAVCPKLSPVRSSGAFFQFLKVFPLDNNDMGTPEVVG